MKLQIASAFGHRQRPAKVTQLTAHGPLCADSLHFEGMDCTQVAAKDWKEYSDAFAGLSAEAFVYFLPSLLALSLEKANLPLVAADSLVASLDTSGDPDLWTDWFCARFGQLTPDEIDVLQNWSAVYLASGARGEGSEYARVQDTLAMLRLSLED